MNSRDIKNFLDDVYNSLPGNEKAGGNPGTE
jgi:hypothetical protein